QGRRLAARDAQRAQHAVLAEVRCQRIALRGEALLILDEARLLALVFAPAVVLEQQAGHVAVAGRVGRPARQERLGWQRITLVVALVQLAHELPLDAARAQEVGLRRRPRAGPL